jgi:hypothetical protein
LEVEGGLAVPFAFQPLATASSRVRLFSLDGHWQWKNGGENKSRQKKQDWMGHVLVKFLWFFF